jgi:hypothetical protein
VDRRFHGDRRQADRHDQQKLTGLTVLVVLMCLTCTPRRRATSC